MNNELLESVLDNNRPLFVVMAMVVCLATVGCFVVKCVVGLPLFVFKSVETIAVDLSGFIVAEVIEIPADEEEDDDGKLSETLVASVSVPVAVTSSGLSVDAAIE